MTGMNRRDFLAATAAAGGALALNGASSCPAADNFLFGPCPPSAWKKQGVVLSAGAGWIQNFTCSAEPLENDRWRLWYTQRPETKGPSVIGFAEGTPGEKMNRIPAVVSPGEPADAPLSIGNLPDGWHPVQPVHLLLQKGRHRLYFWAHGPKVVRYLVAESEDGRRYKVLDPARPCLYHPADRAVDGRTAAEFGLSRMANKTATKPEGEPAAKAVQVSNDATNVYQLDDGSFEMYSVGLVEVGRDHPGHVAHDNCPGWLRVIDYYRSPDGLTFPERRRVIVADERDPPDMQFYFLAVNHTGLGREGMLGHYRCQAQTMDIEWCFSFDGIRWHRPKRQAWIPRGQPGEPDCYGIYAPHSLVFHQNRYHLFYTATNAAHNKKHSHGPPTQVVMHAVSDEGWSWSHPRP